MNKNRVCEILGIEKPIIQAPMLWVCDPNLVVAVCEAGGLGTLGINGGYNTRVATVEETAERTRTAIKEIKSRTDKPFAFNYMLPVPGQTDDEQYNKFSEGTLKVALEEGVAAVIAVGQPNAEKIRELKEKGLIVIYRELAPTQEGARIAEEAGADMIVATGIDEGGCAPFNPIGTFSIVPVIADAVNIPVLAAGGVCDHRGVNAAFALGAEGVFVGTAFIASKEGPSHEKTKQAIVDAKSTDTLTYMTKIGYERYIPNKFTSEEYADFRNRKQAEYVVNYERKGPLEGYLFGDTENGTISVNAAVSLIKEVKSCKEIIDDFFPEW